MYIVIVLFNEIDLNQNALTNSFSPADEQLARHALPAALMISLFYIILSFQIYESERQMYDLH